MLEREALETGVADSSSHWLAGAKPSRLMSAAVLLGPVGQLQDDVLNLFAGRLPKGLDPAGVGERSPFPSIAGDREPTLRGS